MKKAIEKDYELMNRLDRYGIDATRDQCRELRRIELTLTRWAEELCNGTIQVDENGENPVRWYELRDGSHCKGGPVPNREKGALRRLKSICKDIGVHFYHQTDPRGCAVYVGNEPLTAQNYHQNASCCID